jgi:hypothetical protein
LKLKDRDRRCAGNQESDRSGRIAAFMSVNPGIKGGRSAAIQFGRFLDCRSLRFVPSRWKWDSTRPVDAKYPDLASITEIGVSRSLSSSDHGVIAATRQSEAQKNARSLARVGFI